MVGRLGKTGNMDIDNVDVFSYDVFHNCHNNLRNHHRICHIGQNSA